MPIVVLATTIMLGTMSWLFVKWVETIDKGRVAVSESTKRFRALVREQMIENLRADAKSHAELVEQDKRIDRLSERLERHGHH